MKISKKIRLGIIGGGQLGKMLVLEARRLGFYFLVVLDPEPDSPAGKLADEQIVASLHDKVAIKNLAKKVDIITYEIENVNVEVLKELATKGYNINPSPNILEIVQNKFKQKEFLSQNKIPTAKFKRVVEPLEKEILNFGFPVVQKSCFGGYDGRGVFVINNKEDLSMALKRESFLEEKVNIEKELSILIARNCYGEIKSYPVVEMFFNKKNICDTVIVPAKIEESLQKKAKDIAEKCVKLLNGVGIFAIELFLTSNGKILVNEISPRPHNSGHYTIESCKTSQFEQHLRAISGFPLGSTELISKSVMINILGEPDYKGEPVIEGLDKIFSIEGAKFHFYDKKITFPYRKMGHVTILDRSLNNAIRKSFIIKKFLKIKSVKKI